MRVEEFTEWPAPPSERPLASLDADAIDVELQKRSQADAQLRLRMGELLDALFLTRGHHELGFSSIDGYAGERSGESARWAQESRALARRLRERDLCLLRGALLCGAVSWSMAEVLSRHATSETEAALITSARELTVRQMQTALMPASERVHVPDVEDEDPDTKRRRRHAVSRGELAMLHTSRLLVSYLSNARVSDESFMTALLGETESNLAAWRDRLEEQPGSPTPLREERIEVARRALEALMARAEGLRFELPSPSEHAGLSDRSEARIELRPVLAPVLPSDPCHLDRAITHLAARRSKRAVELARLALQFLERRLWRRLGFASLGAYVEARPGICLSTLEHQATLGRHLRRYPSLAAALEAGKIGTEAAMLIGRVLGRWSDSVHAAAWIERARVRTCRCLREEVWLVQMGLSFDPRVSRMPPGLEDLEAAADLERRVQSGELYRSLMGPRLSGPQTSVTFTACEAEDASALGLKPAFSLWLSDELDRHFRLIEAEFRALAGPKASFLAFMCASLWTTWMPYLEAWDDKWAPVYRRDLHRCQNPVCTRRDVTPHHVEFKAHGGGDELENMVSLCAWCHLEGVHGGRLRVRGRAPNLSWRLGRRPTMEIEGRELIAAAGRL